MTRSSLAGEFRSARRVRVVVAAAVGLLLGVAASVHAQTLSVASTSPLLNAENVPRNTAISVTFDRAVNTATFTPANFWVFGKLTGPVAGALSFSNANQTVTLTPTRPLLTGEVVMVIMSRNLRGADGSSLRSAGYIATFTTGGASPPASPRTFRQRSVVSNRDNTGAQTRIYGGVACDLNRDGWSDMTTINEVSSDMRVMLNRADGTGFNTTMVTPYTPIPVESSPNEVGDFDRDGFIDVVTSSNQTNQIAVCLGNGDGTFRTPTLINVGQNPRGFGIIDANGDGALDIAVANANSNSVSLMINNGNGTFAAPTTINVPGGPYGMTAADMNNDGLLDLVCGCRNDQTCRVLLANPAGGFTAMPSVPIGGQNWVVVCADLNNDRRMDVSAANSFSSNGSILFGNGAGGLTPATVYSVGGHSVSTDLADINNDGYPDWILSSFGAGIWYVYINNGSGVFTPLTEVVAPANPSCAVPVDIDNDGFIDLVLTDEIADVLVTMMNVCRGDFNTFGGVTVQDIFDFLAAWFAGDPRADVNGQNGVTVQDVFDFLSAWFTPC